MQLQHDNPLFRRLPEAARKELLAREVGDSTEVAQRNLADATELSQIRSSRAAPAGCDCHPLSQDIKKLSQKRIKHELLLRQADGSGNRQEMADRLRALTASEPLCCAKLVAATPLSPMLSSDTPSSCACVDAGIQCSQACRCCGFAQPAGCANPEGKTVYDALAVRSFRAGMLRSPACSPNPGVSARIMSEISDFELTPSVRAAEPVAAWTGTCLLMRVVRAQDASSCSVDAGMSLLHNTTVSQQASSVLSH